ncbi:hypothetical protein [Dyadobacter sediminis]|uniref:Lipoprotein n=1 Tax=Dyadobacter sediminis TaxID=1493691 RepID=A0A5R9K7F1_9BACT|nr:hypothetical protein [Dyadobacter sediminis]TLU89771.1 hypothetical protein FEM55_19735 [Dyadobacter sediminis]
MRKNRIILSVIMTVIAAISISSCTYRSYNPGYDYGYRYGYGYRYPAPPPPPRRVIVKHSPPPRVVHAERHRSSRQYDRNYRRQYNRGNQYGRNSARTHGPRR